ncbi:MAG: hypothetical protein WDO12_11310 [Pseudomonadota bacterium]
MVDQQIPPKSKSQVVPEELDTGKDEVETVASKDKAGTQDESVEGGGDSHSDATEGEDEDYKKDNK